MLWANRRSRTDTPIESPPEHPLSAESSKARITLTIAFTSEDGAERTSAPATERFRGSASVHDPLRHEGDRGKSTSRTIPSATGAGEHQRRRGRLVLAQTDRQRPRLLEAALIAFAYDGRCDAGRTTAAAHGDLRVSRGEGAPIFGPTPALCGFAPCCAVRTVAEGEHAAPRETDVVLILYSMTLHEGLKHEVGVREFHDHLSRYVRHVADGGEIVVTMRGKRVARLTPVDQPDPLDDLRARGLVSDPSARWRPRRRGRARADVSDLVADQRR
jgi:prevent-host-death family protein